MAPKIIQFQLLQTHCRKGDDGAKNQQMSRWDELCCPLLYMESGSSPTIMGATCPIRWSPCQFESDPGMSPSDSSVKLQRCASAAIGRGWSFCFDITDFDITDFDITETDSTNLI